MRMMDLSVIIPVYNTELHFEKCIKSVISAISNSYISSEIIVINDGSQGNIDELIKKYLNCKESIITYIKQENKGRGATRNLGIRKAEGKYISFIDSDDYIDEEMYKKMLNKLREEKSDMAICDIECIHTYSPEKNGSLYAISKRCNNKLRFFNEIILPSCCNKIIKKELFEGIEFPENINYEDLATIPAIVLKAKNISYISEPLYKYVQNSDSIMHQKFGENQLTLIDALEIMCENIEKTNVSEDLIKKAEYITYTKRFYEILLENIVLLKEKKLIVRKFCNKIKNIDKKFWHNKYFLNFIYSQGYLKKYGNLLFHKAIQEERYNLINICLKEKIFYRFIFVNNMSIGEEEIEK